MGSVSQSRRFLNYPEPLKGPDVPYKNERKPNPAIRGFLILAAAFLMEWVRYIREKAWHNAGFGSLRKITKFIEDYEPWFEPQIVPLPHASDDDDNNNADSEAETEAEAEAVSGARAAESDTTLNANRYPQANKYYSVADYRQLFLSGALTPTQVAEGLLPLIRRDTSPPGEHSIAFFQTRAEKVLAAAEASTQRYKEKRSLGPLDGVPTAVKDEYDIDGYRSCLGSKNDYTGEALEGDTNTSWLVRRLQAAGTVNLGKLSMHEFGLDTTGNNPIYGTPRNPHNPNYYTGGSSSGTGYAVATGLIPIGLGSDGGGSIRIPSSMCGVFGIKPTHGRLSFKPGQNHCVTCACLGPIAADVDSLATVFQVISSPPHPSSPFPPMRPMRGLKNLESGKIQGPKILGIPRDWNKRSTPAISLLFNAMINRLEKEHGYKTVPIEIPFLAEGQTAHAMTVLTDAATLLPETRSLTAANRMLLALGRVTPATDYLLAQKLRRVLMQHLAWLWQEYPGMLIMTPTTSCEGWPIRDSAELKYGVSDGDQTLQSMEYVWLANFCGLPSLSLPMGFVPPAKGLGSKSEKSDGHIPVGLMATGEWCSEEQLLEFGRVAEEVGKEQIRRPPGWVDVVKRAKELHEQRTA
ncbi:amidase signature domain-containing protein [Diplogelasinospora grovesii]|uniref:Amidase signature domain-containing protein n=1 Tax=Diplogelasinospora grovesii TaxID=303347 RepID=A0AAN6N966_9PEZI|nr:amidase signature domain-containing protein [Diplogelasinospora grovesii]